MSNSAIITLAQDISVRIGRLWWPLRAGRVGQVGRLLWDLADRLRRTEADANMAEELAWKISGQRGRINDLQVLVESQELTIARLAGELHAERERCARLVLQQKRGMK